MNINFRRQFAAVAVGNILEWFDFAVFGAFADVIGNEFFPASSTEVQLLKSLSVFGAGFAMRPVGGIIIGWIGDRWGRKRALEISIALMLFPSFLIGCLPPFSRFGIASTIILVFLRMMQGIAVGGELIGAFIYTVEATGGQSRGFWGASCKATGNLGTSLGMGSAALLRACLTSEQLRIWGWRIPFWSGLLLGIVGIWLRAGIRESEYDSQLASVERSKQLTHNDMKSKDAEIVIQLTLDDSANLHLPEYTYPPPPFDAARMSPKVGSTSLATLSLTEGFKNPINEVLRYHGCSLFVVALVSAYWGATYYTTFIWLSYFMSDENMIGGRGVDYAWIINFAMNSAMVVLFPFAGMLGDYVHEAYMFQNTSGTAASTDTWSTHTQGKRPSHVLETADGFITVMKIALLLSIVLTAPAFILICTRTVWGAIIGQFLLMVGLSIFGANLPAFLVSQFPSNSRFTGVGLAYNTANALFAGSAPVLQTMLVTVHVTERESSIASIFDQRLRPAFYLMSVACLSLFSLAVLVPISKKYSPDLGVNSNRESSEHAAENTHVDWNINSIDGDSVNLLHAMNGQHQHKSCDRPANRHKPSNSDIGGCRHERIINSGICYQHSHYPWDGISSIQLGNYFASTNKRLATNFENNRARESLHRSLHIGTTTPLAVNENDKKRLNPFPVLLSDTRPSLGDHSKSMSI